MDTGKIRSLVAELEADIKIRQEAVQGLRKLLANSQGPQVESEVAGNLAQPMLFASTDSYVDLTVKIITANGYEPMPMKEIAERIRLLKNNPGIERRSIESTLTQHVANKGDQSRVVRVDRGIWGVRRFPREVTSAA